MGVSSSRLTSPPTRDPDAPHRESDAEYNVVSPPASKEASTTVSRPLSSKAATVSGFPLGNDRYGSGDHRQCGQDPDKPCQTMQPAGNLKSK